MDKEKEAGFMRMFVAHEPELRAFLRTLLPSWELVDDVLQEASVVMWSKLDQLENRNLVLMPYQRSGALSELAQRTNRSVNSLYKLLGRLREKLRLCVDQKLITKGGQS